MRIRCNSSRKYVASDEKKHKPGKEQSSISLQLLVTWRGEEVGGQWGPITTFPKGLRSDRNRRCPEAPRRKCGKEDEGRHGRDGEEEIGKAPSEKFLYVLRRLVKSSANQLRAPRNGREREIIAADEKRRRLAGGD